MPGEQENTVNGGRWKVLRQRWGVGRSCHQGKPQWALGTTAEVTPSNIHTLLLSMGYRHQLKTQVCGVTPAHLSESLENTGWLQAVSDKWDTESDF